MERIRKYAEKLIDLLLPFLLCAVIMSAALYIYTETAVNRYTVLAAAITAVCFAVFENLRKIKLGGLIYFIIMIPVSFAPRLFLHRGDIFDFIQWFFSGAQAVATRPALALTFTVMFGFFFSSVVYYFTNIAYRSAAVALVSLIPFALAVKVVMALPYYYPVIAASLNLFLFIYYGRKSLTAGSKRTGGRPIVIYGDFALAAALLAFIIPKPNVTPFYEQFEAATNVIRFGGSGSDDYFGRYYENSGNADEFLKGESRLLYVVSTPEPAYMKAQVFDLYDAEMRYWTSLGDVEGSRNWKESAERLSFEKLAAAAAEAAEINPDIYEAYPWIEKLGEIAESESYSIVYTREYPAAYILAPLRTKDVVISNANIRFTARSDKGELFADSFLPADANYTVRYYSENYEQLFGSGLCDMTFDDYGSFLSKLFTSYIAYNADDSDSEGYKAVKSFYNEYNLAYRYKKDTETQVSAEIQALADELTAGLEYDYQKAKAIEQYFFSGNFMYSLGYEAPAELDTPEYFLFTSKTGTCSDFATAYTLLARAAGLTVRYAEGFIPSRQQNSDSYYYIYTDNAHAYPEVFIPMAGWVRYEPTVGGSSGEGRGADDAETDRLALILTAAVVVAALALIIIFMLFIPKMLEGLFRIKIRFCGNNKAVSLLYKRHIKILGAKLEIDYEPLTPEEASELTEIRTGISLEPLASAFNMVCYGDMAIADSMRCKAYDCYKVQSKELNRKKKRKESKS